VRNPFVAAAVLSCLATFAAYSADGGELGEVREQLNLLLPRVERLESENVAIKAENETLKTQADYLKSETRGLRKEAAAQASEVAKVKGADWASKIALKGDRRYRYEQISDETRNSSGALATADRSARSSR
jgi:cell division septum initiation protein DivIVA